MQSAQLLIGLPSLNWCLTTQVQLLARTAVLNGTRKTIYSPGRGGPGQVGHLDIQLELYELILEFNQLRSDERPPQSILQGGVDAGLNVVGINGDTGFEEEVVKFPKNEVRVLDALLCAGKTVFVPPGISFIPGD